MTPTYAGRMARTSDIHAITALVREAAVWLAALGLDQWQGDEERCRSRVHTDIVAGSVWVVEDGGVVVATITVDEWADADFWRHSDHVHDALYAHRMTVARSHRGRGLGSALLDLAADLAERECRSWLRFDAWSTNDALHRYYERLGFEMVRNVPVDGRGSGALFEGKASERRKGPSRIVVAHTEAGRAAYLPVRWTTPPGQPSRSNRELVPA